MSPLRGRGFVFDVLRLAKLDRVFGIYDNVERARVAVTSRGGESTTPSEATV